MQLLHSDIKLMLNIIDVVASRGAIKPNEFVDVGELVQKLNGITDEDTSEKQDDLPQLLVESDPNQLQFEFDK